RFIYEVRGEGTAILSGLKAGEGLDILAPLGRGFRLNNVKKVLLIGGGIGVPPLLGVARQHCRLSGIEAEAVLGFRTKSAAILLEDFSKTVQAVHVATDDGTLQAHGTVTDTVRSRLEKVRFDLICACGPTPMLKTVAALAEEFSVACQVSLEERMACGVGACLVCACALKGKKQYAHVCKDGPVFDYMEVVF
ncbi:MAG: dihydroorotate dehydrogenase electron transfer subunit, partial [Oscillospiraceae bacterium]|nr:dihydroorotate dehydrogenase electron transfer subunit [Oscillospiraceae bacterium]